MQTPSLRFPRDVICSRFSFSKYDSGYFGHLDFIRFFIFEFDGSISGISFLVQLVETFVVSIGKPMRNITYLLFGAMSWPLLSVLIKINRAHTRAWRNYKRVSKAKRYKHFKTPQIKSIIKTREKIIEPLNLRMHKHYHEKSRKMVMRWDIWSYWNQKHVDDHFRSGLPLSQVLRKLACLEGGWWRHSVTYVRN